MSIPGELRPGGDARGNWRAINALIQTVKNFAARLSNVESRVPRRQKDTPADALHDFQIFNSAAAASDTTPDPAAWRTFEVHTGKVSCKTPDNDDSAGDPLKIVVDANTDKHYVWFEAEVKLRNGGEMLEPLVQSVTIKDGTDPKTEEWEKFPDQDFGSGDTITVRCVIGTIKTGSDDPLADDGQKADLWQNIRGSVTVGLLVDHVRVLSGKLKVWRKIVVFQPDNYVECPEEQFVSSSSAPSSSHKSSTPAESSGTHHSHPTHSNSSGGLVSSHGLVSEEDHWLYRVYRPPGAGWNVVTMEDGWLWCDNDTDPTVVSLDGDIAVNATAENPLVIALKVQFSNLTGVDDDPSFEASIVTGLKDSLDLSPTVNLKQKKPDDWPGPVKAPDNGTLYLEIAEISTDGGVLQIFEKWRDQVSFILSLSGAAPNSYQAYFLSPNSGSPEILPFGEPMLVGGRCPIEEFNILADGNFATRTIVGNLTGTIDDDGNYMLNVYMTTDYLWQGLLCYQVLSQDPTQIETSPVDNDPVDED